MMAISQLEALTYANQNMNVVASKQNDYRNRIESQAYAMVAKIAKKEKQIEGSEGLADSKGIDAEREHNREIAEEESGEKSQETIFRYPKKPKTKEEKLKDDLNFKTPYRILDIKV